MSERTSNRKGLNADSKIYVAGHRGLVGSAIMKNLRERGFRNVVGRSHGELDLTDAGAVRHFFDKEKPEAVVLAAAHVGGIMANSTYRADFIIDNLAIQQNVITEAWRHGVKHLLFLGSSCIYPRCAPQPLKEDMLLTSPLEYTNEPYAIAKIAGMKMCESLNLQYGTEFVSVMPTNLYGPNDNFDLEKSHVLPAMIRKIHLARLLGNENFDSLKEDLTKRTVTGFFPDMNNDAVVELLKSYGIFGDKVVLWGTGKPMREFLWSEDMADAAVHVLLNVTFDALKKDTLPDVRNTHINIGTGIEHSISETAEMIRDAVGFNGRIVWDSSKPDGTPRKLCDVTRLHSLGWKHKIELQEGIRKLYDWYLNN